jgi:hypothetical protein
MSLFVFCISLLIVSQHVSGNHVPIIRSWWLRDVTASCWYVPWLREGCQVPLAGSASRIQKVTSSWFFLSTLNYDARSTTHQSCNKIGTSVTLVIWYGSAPTPTIIWSSNCQAGWRGLCTAHGIIMHICRHTDALCTGAYVRTQLPQIAAINT